MANESWIFFNDLIKDATGAASTSAANRGIEKLVNGIVKSTWRSTVITETTITYDFGAATSIAGMSFHFHNVESGDTAYLFEASTDNFSTTSESETVTLVTRTVKEKNSNGVLKDVTRRDMYHVDSWNYRYYRLRITKASGSYIEGGELAIWKNYYSFDKNFIIGYTGGQQNFHAGNRQPAGQLTRSLKHSTFFLPMEFRNISDAQKDKLQEAGQSDYIAYYHNMSDKIYWGGLTVNTPVNVRTTNEVTPAELWNVTATFEESL